MILRLWRVEADSLQRVTKSKTVETVSATFEQAFKIMSLNSDYQETGAGQHIRLFDVDGTVFECSDVLRFRPQYCPYPDEISAAGGDENKLPAKSIWQGQEYKSPPRQIEGIETATDGDQRAADARSLTRTVPLRFCVLLCDDDPVAAGKGHDSRHAGAVSGCENYPEGNQSADPQQEKLKVFSLTPRAPKPMRWWRLHCPVQMDPQG